MTHSSVRDRWRDAVAATPHVSDTVKMVLLVLAEEMRQDGYVKYSLEKVARRVGKSERAVLRSYARAIDAGLLTRTSRGYEGHTAIYRAMLPDTQRVTPGVILSRPQRVTKKDTLSDVSPVTLSTLKRVTPPVTPVVRGGLPTQVTSSTNGVGEERQLEAEDTDHDRALRTLLAVFPGAEILEDRAMAVAS